MPKLTLSPGEETSAQYTLLSAATSFKVARKAWALRIKLNSGMQFPNVSKVT